MNQRSGDRHVSSQTVQDLRILWIDDEPALLRSWVALLEEAGCHVDLVENGADGLARARFRSPNVVLLDLNLPDMPGLSVLEALQRDQMVTPVIIVSGYGTATTGFEARRLGAVEFLAKPFRGFELLALVQRVASECCKAGGDQQPIRAGVQSQAMIGGVFQGPAHVRVAKAIVIIAESPRDIPTVAKWAELVGPAQHTLTNWCAAANVGPSDVLRFGRLLRASIQFERFGHDFSESLDVVDPRTRSRLFHVAGATAPLNSPPRTVAAFLDRQRALHSPTVLRVVREFLANRFADLTSLH